MDAAAVLLGFVTIQRLAELAWARRNAARLLASGGIEFGRAHYPLMVAVHAAWLGGMWVLGHGVAVDPAFVIAYAALQAARLYVLASLGRRWTTRVIVIPGAPLVTRGPYRLVKHPNYWIVAGEVAVVPLALGLPLYAALFSVLNAIVMAVRIRVENAALTMAGAQDAIPAPPAGGPDAGRTS
jgi:methyltransferase